MNDIQNTQDIKNYIVSNRGSYGGWYVGVTSDPRDRLFNGHGVIEKDDAWIFSIYSSDATARAAESYFLKTLGTDGGPGGGNDPCKCVYAYKKASHTNP